jgi:hypothetical protein
MPRSGKQLLFEFVRMTDYCCGLNELGGIQLGVPDQDFWAYTLPKNLHDKFKGAFFAVTQKEKKKLTKAMTEAGFTALVEWAGEHGKAVVLWFKWPKRSRKRKLI